MALSAMRINAVWLKMIVLKHKDSCVVMLLWSHLSCSSNVQVAGGSKSPGWTSPTAGFPAVLYSSRLLLKKRDSLQKGQVGPPF